MVNYILIFDHDSRRKIEILVKALFWFSIIVFNKMKILVLLFMIKLFTETNVFKKVLVAFTRYFF